MYIYGGRRIMTKNRAISFRSASRSLDIYIKLRLSKISRQLAYIPAALVAVSAAYSPLLSLSIIHIYHLSARDRTSGNNPHALSRPHTRLYVSLSFLYTSRSHTKLVARVFIFFCCWEERENSKVYIQLYYNSLIRLFAKVSAVSSDKKKKKIVCKSFLLQANVMQRADWIAERYADNVCV